MSRSSRRSCSQFQPTFLDILPLYILLLAAFPMILIGAAPALRDRAGPVPSALLGGADHKSVDAGLSGRPRLVFQSSRLAVSVRRRGCARPGSAAGSGRGRAGAAPFCPARRDDRSRRGLSSRSAGRSTASGTPSPGCCSRSCGRPTRAICRRSGCPVLRHGRGRRRPGAAATAVFLRSAAASRWCFAGSNRSRFSASASCSRRSGISSSRNTIRSPVQLAVNLAGILAMCLTARVIDWYKTMGRDADAGQSAVVPPRGGRVGT